MQQAHIALDHMGDQRTARPMEKALDVDDPRVAHAIKALAAKVWRR